jgi:hypothetical protein
MPRKKARCPKRLHRQRYSAAPTTGDARRRHLASSPRNFLAAVLMTGTLYWTTLIESKTLVRSFIEENVDGHWQLPAGVVSGALVGRVFPRFVAGLVERVAAMRAGVDARAGGSATLGAGGRWDRCVVGLVDVRLVRIGISNKYSQCRTNCDSGE